MTSPFESPWDILAELGPILEDINASFPNPPFIKDGIIYAIHSPEYSSALGWKHSIEQCSWKLPFIHLAILKREKIKKSGGCCGINLCDLLANIAALRPATKSKVLDGSWRASYIKDVHDPICCLQNIDDEDTIKDNNTYHSIIEVPNECHDHLVGFSYPNHRIPPIVQLIRPVAYGEELCPTEKQSKDDDSDISKNRYIYSSRNVDGISKVFGAYNKIPDTFTSSPLKSRKSWASQPELCGQLDNFRTMDQKISPRETVDFEVNEPCCLNIPLLKCSVDIVINLSKDVSQYIPPMFLPKNRIDSIELGSGEEMGVYKNYKLISHNFMTQFLCDSYIIGPLVRTDPFEKTACSGGLSPTGIDRERALW